MPNSLRHDVANGLNLLKTERLSIPQMRKMAQILLTLDRHIGSGLTQEQKALLLARFPDTKILSLERLTRSKPKRANKGL